MAFIRPVMMAGEIYRSHEAAEATISPGQESIYVRSYELEDRTGKVRESRHIRAFDADSVFADAEEWLQSIPAFKEYEDPAQEKLDEVLEILTDEQAETVPDAFPAWVPNTDYKAGDRRRYSDGYLYKCVQAHRSQEGWEPPNAPALWTRIGEPGEIPVWVQPTGAQDAYNTGDKVHFPTIDDPVYESTIDGNVWSPADYPGGWKEVAE